MLEAVVRVVRVEGPTAWVEAEHRSACGHCGSAAQCGSGVLAGLFSGRRGLMAIDSGREFDVGDRLVVGVSDDLLRRASVAAYLWPLLCMAVPAAFADAAGLGNGPVALAALGGLAFGFASVAWRTRRSGGLYRPRVLRREGAVFPLTKLNLGVDR